MAVKIGRSPPVIIRLQSRNRSGIYPTKCRPKRALDDYAKKNLTQRRKDAKVQRLGSERMRNTQHDGRDDLVLVRLPRIIA